MRHSVFGWLLIQGLMILGLVGCSEPPRSRVVDRPFEAARVETDDPTAESAEAPVRVSRVALGDVTRTAQTVTVEHPGSMPLPLAAGSERLELAFGLPESSPGARFVLTVVPAGSNEAPAPQPLLELEVAGSDADQWLDQTLELGPWATVEGRLELVIEPLDADAAETPVGYWGDARLLGPGDGEPLPDVVLVVIDTLRADRLSHYGYPRPTSPRLGGWAQRAAVTFETVVAAAPWTLPTHISLFTGLDPISHGVLGPKDVAVGLDLLAEKLQRQGYETLAITGGGYLDPTYGLAEGFDRYFTFQRQATPGTPRDRQELHLGLSRARQWLADLDAAGDRPFFLFLHTYEVHQPLRVRQPFFSTLAPDITPPDWLKHLYPNRLEQGDTAGAVVRRGFTRRFDPEDRNRLRPLTAAELEQVSAAYDSGVAFTDHLLGLFFEELGRRRQARLMVVTSDHGEGLGEHGLAGHSYLHDFNLLVPLILELPDGQGAGQRIEQPVRQIDVLPTLLEALGMEIPEGLDGQSLMPMLDGEPGPPDEAWAMSEVQGVALRTARSKYVLNTTPWQRRRAAEALFDLRDDPSESHNRADEQPTDGLRRRVRERYFSNFQGWVIHANNPTGTRRELLIQGVRPIPSIEVVVFGAADLAKTDRGRWRVGLEPGESVTVALEGLESPPPGQGGRRPLVRLEPLEGAVDDARSPRCSVDLGRLLEVDKPRTEESGWRRWHFDASCRRRTADPEAGFSFALDWAPGDGAGRATAQPSAELEQELRALGYLDG